MFAWCGKSVSKSSLTVRAKKKVGSFHLPTLMCHGLQVRQSPGVPCSCRCTNRLSRQFLCLMALSIYSIACCRVHSVCLFSVRSIAEVKQTCRALFSRTLASRMRSRLSGYCLLSVKGLGTFDAICMHLSCQNLLTKGRCLDTLEVHGLAFCWHSTT